jgi:RNA polymerase sigma-70 factor (ECF subfamily)
MIPDTGSGKISAAVCDEMARLYNDHALVLCRYGLLLAGSREAAQDAVHEAFLRYYHARGAGQQIPNPKPWLFRVLRNHILDQRRAQQSRREIGLENLSQAPDGAPDPESLCWRSELSRSLAAALAPRERECFRLRAEGLRYAEIAEILGIRSGTVGALLARAHQKLRTIGGGLRSSGKMAGPELNCAREEPYAP